MVNGAAEAAHHAGAVTARLKPRTTFE